jgi:hypothetical protein
MPRGCTIEWFFCGGNSLGLFALWSLVPILMKIVFPLFMLGFSHILHLFEDVRVFFHNMCGHLLAISELLSALISASHFPPISLHVIVFMRPDLHLLLAAAT